MRGKQEGLLRVLLVEDDAMLGEAVRNGLRQDGYVVDWVMETRAALAALATTSFSALVLDLGLPNTDGSVVLRWLRAQGDPLPTVVTTAGDRIADRIASLDAGADDYLVKPFDLDELAARLRAVMRRAAMEYRSPELRYILRAKLRGQAPRRKAHRRALLHIIFHSSPYLFNTRGGALSTAPRSMHIVAASPCLPNAS